MSPYPAIEDPESVDARRASVTLPPLADAIATHRDGARRSGETPPADLAARRAEMDAWARAAGWRE
jgi:hypothetical protein